MGILQGRTAFVTGAASGIGRAITVRFASEGARVVVADLNVDGGRAIEQAVRDAGGDALAVPVDVTQYDSVCAAVERTGAAFGPVEILVNNAGWDRIEPFLDNTPELWDKLIAVNLKGPIHCCRAVADGMIARGGGKIVNISSDAARVGSKGESVYAACKGGVLSLSKALAREFAPHRINVNVVCPGPTQTRLIDELTQTEQGAKIIAAMARASPFGRLANPEEIAGAVTFLASADADFITGQVLSVSGGLTMAG